MGILIVTIMLGAAVEITKTNHTRNAFVRLLPPHACDFEKAIILDSKSYSIAGIDAQHVYLQNRQLGKVIGARILTGDTNTLVKGKPVAQREFKVIDQKINRINHSLGEVVRWDFDTTSTCAPPFTAFTPSGKGGAVFRVIDPKLNKNVLVKTSFHNTSSFTRDDILERQIDGIFCTDGILATSSSINRIVYVYYYRNEFICMDTSLNVIYKGKTIDTTTVAKIKIAKTKDRVTMGAPPLLVNRKMAVDGKYLFVNSTLIARNEQPEKTKDQSVIDVYDLLDGTYRMSFCIPKYKNHKMEEFAVNDDAVFAIHDDVLVKYVLRLSAKE